MKLITGLFAVLLSVSALADSYHPDLAKSRVVTLDARSIEAYANSGKPFDLDLGDAQVNVTLAPSPIFPEAGVTILEVAEDGSEKERVMRVPNFTYAGEVTGEDPETSEVRLSIPGGVVEGYVRTSSDWWFIEPLARFSPKAGADQYLVYEARDVSIAVEWQEPVSGTDEVAEDPTIKEDRIPIVTVADIDYWQQSGSELAVLLRHGTLFHNVNGIYRAQFGREFRIPHFAFDRGARFLSNDADALLNLLRDWWTLQKLRERGAILAHLTTGKDLCDNVNGNADQPGRHSLSRQSTSAPLAVRNIILAAHEIGHNFNADHDEAKQDLIEGTNLVWRQTLDAREYSPYVVTVPRFSDGPDPEHDNKARMCPWMALFGFPCR